MIKFFLCALIFFAGIPAYSQSRYDAIVFSLNGDTLSGKILVSKLKDGTDDKKGLQHGILFEDTLGQKKYGPGEIKGYSIKYHTVWAKYLSVQFQERKAQAEAFKFLKVRDEGQKLIWLQYDYLVTAVMDNRSLRDFEEIDYLLLKKGGEKLVIRFGVTLSNKKRVKKFLEDCARAANRTQIADDIASDLPIIVDLYNNCGN